MPIGHINNFYRIDDRDDELSRSNDRIIESCSSMTLHCSENLAVSVSSWKRTRVVYTAVCNANQLAITALPVGKLNIHQLQTVSIANYIKIHKDCSQCVVFFDNLFIISVSKFSVYFNEINSYTLFILFCL